MNTFSNKIQSLRITNPGRSRLALSPTLSSGKDDESKALKPKRPRLSGRKGSLTITTSSQKTSGRFVAIVDFQGFGENDLKFRKGDEIEVINKDEKERKNWWRGKIGNQEGIFPSMYVAQRSGCLVPKEIDFSEISLKESIGKGAFATVRLGAWRKEEIAVKIIREGSLDKNAKNEATFYWLMRHPNVISLLGVCNCYPDYWLVMEYARGGSLSQVLRSFVLPPNIIVKWATQISRAMNYLHNDAPIKNIIHRDLKSRNILIYEPIIDGNLENKTLKITDFGLARQALHTTRLTNAAGTYEWMAPEVFKLHQISTASDVWSFGVVLWEMLTSQIPYHNFNYCQIVYGVGNNTLKLPIPQSCPEPFEILLKSCWNFNPKERPPFSSILKDLQAIESLPFLSDNTGFAALQQEWKDEVERELETRRSESSKSLSSLNQNAATFYKTLETISEHVRKRYAELQKAEMELLEKQIYFAVKQLNSPKKRRKKLNFFSWRKKHTLEIGHPSNFQHKLKTIVEETSISPKIIPNSNWPNQASFVIKSIRINTTSKETTKANIEELDNLKTQETNNYCVKFALKEALKTATCITAGENSFNDPVIIKNSRDSLLPVSVNAAIRPNTLAISTSCDPSQSSSSGTVASIETTNEKIEVSKNVFTIKIVNTPTKSKVYVTGNSPTVVPGLDIQNVFANNAINLKSAMHSSCSSNSMSNILPVQQPGSLFGNCRSFNTGLENHNLNVLTKTTSEDSGLSVDNLENNSPSVFSGPFPYDKVQNRKSWQILKKNKVSELKSFFNHLSNSNQMTVH